jgi:hypothetical protein
MPRSPRALESARARSEAAPAVQSAGAARAAADAVLGAHWSSLHDAWQTATAAGRGGAQPGKEPLPFGVLIAIAEHRMRAMPVLRDAPGQAPGLRRRIDALQAQVRDAQGRNWTVPVPAGGPLSRASDEADFRRVVDALRDQFDLA